MRHVGNTQNDAVFSLRLPARDAELLQREAQTRGVTVSRLAREAIARGLDLMQSGAEITFGIPDQRPDVTLSICTFGMRFTGIRTVGGLTLTLLPA